jgi:hypothetical protein
MIKSLECEVESQVFSMIYVNTDALLSELPENLVSKKTEFTATVLYLL